MLYDASFSRISSLEASNIMDPSSISETFPYGEVLVPICQLGPEILCSLYLPVENLYYYSEL